jgi:hypothetical protein
LRQHELGRLAQRQQALAVAARQPLDQVVLGEGQGNSGAGQIRTVGRPGGPATATADATVARVWAKRGAATVCQRTQARRKTAPATRRAPGYATGMDGSSRSYSRLTTA